MKDVKGASGSHSRSISSTSTGKRISNSDKVRAFASYWDKHIYCHICGAAEATINGETFRNFACECPTQARSEHISHT